MKKKSLTLLSVSIALVLPMLISGCSPGATPTPTPTPTATPIVTEFGFSPSSITLGESVTAWVVLNEGSPGSYTIRFLKDVSSGADEFVSEYSFTLSEGTSKGETQLKPAVIGSYYIEVYYDDLKIWTQPDDASRLVVENPALPAPLSITSSGLSRLSNLLTITITLSGGETGTGVLKFCFASFLTGFSGPPPGQPVRFFLGSQVYDEYPFAHDGTTTTLDYRVDFPFGVFGRGELDFWIELEYDGETAWTSPTLTVTP